MTDETLKAYDAAAAKLQHELQAAHPGYAWWIPDSWHTLDSPTANEWMRDGWLVVYIKDGTYAAWLKVAQGVEHDAAAVKVIGQGLIDHMNTYRG